jgi:hypothetical protein
MKRYVFLITLLLFSLSSLCQKKEIEDYRIPKDIEQALGLLDKLMTEREKFLVRTLPEDSLYYNNEIGHQTNIDYWFNEKSRLTKYFNKMGLDAFGRQYSHYETLLVSYHRYLNSKEIDIVGQIENYKKEWQQESEEYQQKQDSIQRQYQLNKMINESLLSYLNWKSDLISRTCQNCKEYASYICVDNYPSNFSFSKEIQKRNVKFMSLQNLSGQKELKKGKGYGFVFLGISLDQNRIIITVSGKGVSIPKKNHLHMVVGDWGVFTYDYSCENQQWILIETKYGGI